MKNQITDYMPFANEIMQSFAIFKQKRLLQCKQLHLLLHTAM